MLPTSQPDNTRRTMRETLDLVRRALHGPDVPLLDRLMAPAVRRLLRLALRLGIIKLHPKGGARP